MKRLVHLKAVVQHTFAVVDDDGAEEVQAEPQVVPGKLWPTYCMEGFAQAFGELEARLLATDASGDGANRPGPAGDR